MRIRRLKSQRTRDLENKNKRCDSHHPNWKFIKCEFSIDEWHKTHIGENGYYVWHNENRRDERRYVTK